MLLKGLPGGRGAVGFAERPWSEITIRQITKATREILKWDSLDWRCIRYCRPKLTAYWQHYLAWRAIKVYVSSEYVSSMSKARRVVFPPVRGRTKSDSAIFYQTKGPSSESTSWLKSSSSSSSTSSLSSPSSKKGRVEPSKRQRQQFWAFLTAQHNAPSRCQLGCSGSQNWK